MRCHIPLTFVTSEMNQLKKSVKYGSHLTLHKTGIKVLNKTNTMPRFYFSKCWWCPPSRRNIYTERS